MESTKQKSYVLPIAMMFALFAMISFVTGLPQPFGAIVQNEFGASNFEATLGFFANFIAYAFMGIPAGMLLQKIGYKKTALIAIVVGFVGVGIQVLSSKMGFATYVAGAFVSGFSMCMLNTVVNPMLNTLGGGGKKGNQLIQMGGSLNSVSATIVPVLVGYLMGTVVEERTIAKALPALYIAMAIFAVAFLVLFIMNIPEPSLAKANNNVKNEHSPLAFRHFKLGALAIFVYVGIEVGIPHFAGLFMMTPEAGGGLAIDSTIAGSVVGTYWFLMLIGRLVGASLGAKFTSKAMLTVASGVGILFIILAFICPITTMVSMPVFKSDISFGVAQVPISIMFMALCGLCTSIMWGGIFNLAVEGLGKYTEAASGIFMVLVCGGILPLIQGQIADMSGFMTSYVVILIALAYLLFYALVGCKNVNKDIPVE